MAASYIFECPVCNFRAESWDEGNPFILDDVGVRRFYYHPAGGQEVEQIVASAKWARNKSGAAPRAAINLHSGNLSDAICLDCATLQKPKLVKDARHCHDCGSSQLREVLELGGTACPKCKSALFPKHPTLGGVS